MTVKKRVDPSQIETELLHIWEGLSKIKIRAGLFNLIVYNQFSGRTDYIRSIVQKVIEKFPCRVLFISHDAQSTSSYLKTSISVIASNEKESASACDQIDIEVAGNDLERVLFVLPPHILPDLPIYLLWTDDPCKSNPLFSPLSRQANRIIFDSECADKLGPFAEKVLELKKDTGRDFADLNWARTEGWRDLIASTFDSPERVLELEELASIQITYNSRENEFFCHTKVQSLYLLAWLSSRLNWRLKETSSDLRYQFDSSCCPVDVSIASTLWPKLGSGTVISIDFKTKREHLYQFMRIPDRYHYVGIQISTSEKCEIPFQYVLGQTATGQSLVQEITRKGTSLHYLDMLQKLIPLDSGGR